MQVPLESLSLKATNLEDSRTRSPQLVQSSPELGMEPCVLQRDSGSGGYPAQQLGFVAKSRVMDECRHAGAGPVVDEGGCPGLAVAG